MIINFLFVLAGEEKTAAQKCIDAVVLALMVGINQRMVVVLAALQVASEEHASHVACQHIGLPLAKQKERGGAHQRVTERLAVQCVA